MLHILDPLRSLQLGGTAFRVVLAVLFGGVVGMERGRKGRAAGMRTYMLVCLGACLTILLGMYYGNLTENAWASFMDPIGAKVDVSRIGSQVINGIGFLGAGTILVSSDLDVKGLTTAAALWSCACMGLAIGAGFYECVLLAFLLVILVIRVFPKMEAAILRGSRNVNIYVELDAIENIGKVLNRLKEENAKIFEVEVNRVSPTDFPSALLTMQFPHKISHALLLAQLSELGCIRRIEER